MCGRVSRMMLRNSAAMCCGAQSRTRSQGVSSGVTRACVHVRVDRVDHVQECLLRDPVRRGVRHELARRVWSMTVYSAALPLLDNLCPHAASHVRSEGDRDEGARGEDMGWLGLLVHPRSPAGTMRTAVSSRFQMRSCEIPKRLHR